MRIAVVNTLPIPSGNASVNRLLSYSKGLVECGDDVTILSSAFSTKGRGEVSGVSFINYGHGKGSISLLKALFCIVKDIWVEKYDAIVLVSNSLLLIYPLFLVSKFRNIRLIQEKSEFPFVLMKHGVFAKIWAHFYTATTYKLFDGLIVMTKPLMDYLVTKVRKKCKLIEVPMTVDIDRFSIQDNQDENYSNYGDYIAYCGDMSGNKDGVMNLITAFDIASQDIKNINLLLIGGSSDSEEMNKIKKYAKGKGGNRIIFYGKASRDDIPGLLINAKALALARPSSLQSMGGFPTKLGEYLATSKPVVVTAVGDIPRYLNETNSFIIEPDNNVAFADSIIKVFSDYHAAQEVGKRGREVVDLFFNYKVQSQRIHGFIQELL